MNEQEKEKVEQALEKLETATEMDMMSQGPGIYSMASDAKEILEEL